MTEKIIAGVLFSIALAAFVLSLRSFLGKGFLLNGLSVLTKDDRISWLVGGVMAATALYAIFSSVAIEKRKQ